MSSASKFHNIEYIHQILISSTNIQDCNSFKGIVGVNIAEAKRIYSGSKYIFWQNKDIMELIKNNFCPDVLEAYNGITANAYKADLARYCILYAMGGIYVDLGIRLMSTWDIPKNKGFATFKELNFTADSWTVMQNGLIWAEKGRRELKIAIEWIADNYRDKFYGASPLYPTGPILFGRAIACAMSECRQSPQADDQFIGEYRWTTPEHGIKNDAYVAPDHKLIAFRTKTTAGDLSHLGLTGTNNYKELWLSRQVYGESISKFSFSNSGNYYDDRLKIVGGKRTTKGFHIVERASGTIAYGPYITIEKGKYKLNIQVESHSDSILSSKITVDGGKILLSEKSFRLAKTNDTKYLHCYFFLEEKKDLFEVVLISDGTFLGNILGYDIERIDDDYIKSGSTEEEYSGEHSNIKNNFEKKWPTLLPEIQTIFGEKTKYGISVSPGSRGRATHGPYSFVPKGKYEFKIIFDDNTVFRKINVEIAYNKGEKIISKISGGGFIKVKHKVMRSIIELHEDVEDLEFRINVSKDFCGIIKSFELKNIP